MPIPLHSPLTKDNIAELRAGDEILLTGTIYTARDAAHKRLVEAIANGRPLPLELRGAMIYYAGPTPPLGKSSGRRPEHRRRTPPSRGRAIGSCGPTTSSRMDRFTPTLLDRGVIGMIGKGKRSDAVRRVIARYRAVYLLAPAGLGAFCSTKVREARLVAYSDLGPEAIYRLEVVDLPLIVGIDTKGHDVYGA